MELGEAARPNCTLLELVRRFLKLNLYVLEQLYSVAGLDLHHSAAVVGHESSDQLWVPGASSDIPLYPQAAAGAPAQAVYASYDEHKARTPPPDLPSLLLDSRITFLGMPVPSSIVQSGSC